MLKVPARFTLMLRSQVFRSVSTIEPTPRTPAQFAYYSVETSKNFDRLYDSSASTFAASDTCLDAGGHERSALVLAASSVSLRLGLTEIDGHHLGAFGQEPQNRRRTDAVRRHRP